MATVKSWLLRGQWRGKDGECPAWLTHRHPGTQSYSRWALLTSWLLSSVASAYLGVPTPAYHSPPLLLQLPPGSATTRASPGSSQPPLPSFSHLCIQLMSMGHLISTRHCAACWGCRGNKGTCPCHPRAQGGWQQPPHPDLSEGPGSRLFSPSSPWAPSPKVPTATQHGPGPEQCHNSAHPPPG